MKTGFRLGLLVAAAVAAAPAQLLASEITSGGLEAGFGCTTFPPGQCLAGQGTFVYALPTPIAPAVGTVILDTGALTLSFDADVAIGTFFAWDGNLLDLPLTSPQTPDNGIDEIVFTGLNYSATNIAVTFDSGNYNFTGQNLTVSGTYEQFLAGVSQVGPTAFTKTANIPDGTCTTAGALVCHFDVGPGGPFRLGVGIASQPRNFLHTINLISAPEPGTLALMGAGLLGLALRGRKQAVEARR